MISVMDGLTYQDVTTDDTGPGLRLRGERHSRARIARQQLAQPLVMEVRIGIPLGLDNTRTCVPGSPCS